MVSRKAVFVGFLVGCALYQLTKLALGFPATWGVTFDAAYWSAGALMTHWIACREWRQKT